MKNTNFDLRLHQPGMSHRPRILHKIEDSKKSENSVKLLDRMTKLTLRELTEADEPAFLQGFHEYDGEDLHWYTFVWTPGMKWLDHIERLRKNKLGLDMPPDRVPDSIYYGFLDGVIVGRLGLRHQLNEHLRTRGGHIGYSVAPKFRGFGFGREMLAQCLPKAKAMGLDEVLVTCDDDNTPSWKIIEACGGVLESRQRDLKDGKLFRRYWIRT